MTSETTGPKLTEELELALSALLHEVRLGRVSVQSNTARTFASEIGVACSLGMLTTETPEGFGRVWLLTTKGMRWLDGEDL